MLSKIKSINDGFEIQLANPLAKLIYKCDSINLIIGNNGSGKTLLIKSIIRDLLEDESPNEFIAEGNTENLGIIYYSSAPFRRDIKSVKKKYASFFDASSYEHKKSNFIKSAEEYLAVCDALDIKEKLLSIRSFDFSELINELLTYFKPLIRQGEISSAMLEGALVHLDNIDREYSKLNKRRHEFTAIQAESPLHESEASRVMAELNEQIERLARQRIKQKNFVAEIILDEMGPKTKKSLASWIAVSCIMLQHPTRITQRRELVRGLYSKDFQFSTTASTNSWNSMLKAVTSLLRSIEKYAYGEITWDNTSAKITVNIPTLLIRQQEGKVEIKTIEAAHSNDLIGIGFNEISSGEAAILHQVVSIAHAVQELAKDDRKRILVFIDEGDLLLHLSWQSQYIGLMDSRLDHMRRTLELESMQILIATHSPMIATDILKSAINKIDGNGITPSFGAPLQKIVNYSFDTKSMGSVSLNAIQRLKKKKKFTEADKALIQEIDDDFIRDYLIQQVSM